MLQIEPMFETVEGFLNAPALMVEVAELGGRATLLVEQLGHEDAHFAGRGDVAYQAHGFLCRQTLALFSSHHYLGQPLPIDCKVIHLHTELVDEF